MDTLHGFLESSIRLEDWEEVGRVRGRMKAMLLEDSWGLVVRSDLAWLLPRVHFYCQCARVRPLWLWLKARCLAALGLDDLEDESQHPGGNLGVTWMVASYISFIWTESRLGNKLSPRNLTSFLAEEFGRIEGRFSLQLPPLGFSTTSRQEYPRGGGGVTL